MLLRKMPKQAFPNMCIEDSTLKGYQQVQTNIQLVPTCQCFPNLLSFRRTRTCQKKKKKKLFRTLKFCLILTVEAAYYIRTMENVQQQKFQAI